MTINNIIYLKVIWENKRNYWNKTYIILSSAYFPNNWKIDKYIFSEKLKKYTKRNKESIHVFG